MNKWEVILTQKLGLPILKNIVQKLKLEAEKTPNKIDDTIIGIFETAINFLEEPGVIEQK